MCDRYVPSSLVYQGVVRGLGVDAVDALNAVATAGLEPDLVVVLDVADAVAAARAGRRARPARSARATTFHAAVRRGLPRRSRRERGLGRGRRRRRPSTTVAERVWAAVEPLLAG